MNNAFVSIVAHRDKPNLLLVRGRIEGDIEKFLGPELADKFGPVAHSPDADYAYRLAVPRQSVAATLIRQASTIEYDNFKNSIGKSALDNDRHDAYLKIWGVMMGMQERWQRLTSRVKRT